MVEREKVTQEERETILRNFFKGTEKKRLTVLPKQDKKKFVVLQEIVTEFTPGRLYSEKEVNEILIAIHDDYATLRRALADYRLLDRHRDGSAYWVKQ